MAAELARVQTIAGHDASVIYLSSFRFTHTLDPRGLLQLTAELQHLQPDVLHTHMWGPGLVGRLTGRLAKVPVVCTWHAAPYHWGTLSEIRQRLRYLSERVTADTARFTATSQAVRAAWVEATGLDPAAVAVIPNGVDIAAFAPTERVAGGRTALHVGNLIPAKGHDTIVEAAALTDDILWLCAGEGEERPRIQNLISAAAVQDRVQLLGRREDIAALMANADVFILPSRSEGLPVALLEAMACGLTVVAARVGGIAEVIESGRNGILIEPENPRLLADVVEALLDDPDRAAQLGREARQTIEAEFTLTGAADAYVAVYEESLNDRKNSGM